MTEPIKADAMTNLAVAKAAKFENPFISEHSEHFGVCRYGSSHEGFVTFSPTTCEADAMKAAEKVGLFDPAIGCCTLRQVKDKDARLWFLDYFVGDTTFTIYAPLPDLCLALCEAILAVAEKGDNINLLQGAPVIVKFQGRKKGGS